MALALGGCAVIYLLAEGFPLTQTAMELAFSIDKFTMLAIPLFMLAGSLMNAARITDRIFDFAASIVGRVPGGLGHVNVINSLVFAGMSGSALADVASLGPMQVRAMKKHGYDEKLAIGITLASASIALARVGRRAALARRPHVRRHVVDRPPVPVVLEDLSWSQRPPLRPQHRLRCRFCAT